MVAQEPRPVVGGSMNMRYASWFIDDDARMRSCVVPAGASMRTWSVCMPLGLALGWIIDIHSESLSK